MHTYKTLTPLNTEWNRKHKLMNEDGLIVLLLQKNGMSYFVYATSKADQSFYMCADEILNKNFSVTDIEVQLNIESVDKLKYKPYP